MNNKIKVIYQDLLKNELKKKGVSSVNNLSKKGVNNIFEKVNKEISKFKIANIVRNINIEFTTRCSSDCKFCGRQLDKVRYTLDLPLETFKKVPIEDLSEIRFEGTLGDPMHYPYVVDAIKEVEKRRNKKTYICIFTNGNVHNEEWWANIAKLLDFHKNCNVVFGLDGLEDTHSIYRKGTNYRKILKNIKAFIGAGGNANVQMIVFRHNEHQIDDLKKVCTKIGVKNFYTRLSKKYDNVLQEPKKYNLKGRRELNRKEEKKGVPIICGMIHRGSSFLTVDGHLIPCFKWHPRRSFWKGDTKETQDIYLTNIPYMDLNTYGFYEILENSFLKHLKENVQELEECGNICRTLKSVYYKKM